MARVLAPCALLFAALPGWAEESVVYRCTAADGSIRFEANPCGPDATAVTLRPSPAAPPAATKKTRETVAESPQSFALRQQRLAQIEGELRDLAREREALRARHADERMALAVREAPADLKPAQRAAFEKARVREREGVERRQVKEMELLERRAARLERERTRLLQPAGR
ncbi:DUF4124 domain-containing protein [Tepidiphilus baoligensis]|uniref:DUF4124 domain-containing protein n=1 Tax=Tepidiphilus baoligensis TaxID=2698687 RepID=UPI00145F87C5|nr:DUF4124 domain-containing protein [Tepidiphilus baoligensis]